MGRAHRATAVGTDARPLGAWHAAGRERPTLRPSMSTLAERTRFEPAEVEPRIAERWLASGLHHPEPGGTPEENYSIAVPPPNVTGVLHMGHALNGSVQDTLIRYHRMKGMRTKWILGTDHAGIATQKQVEKALEAEGTSREELGREAFVRARLGVARAVRRADHRAVQAPRRDARLRRRALHARRGLRARGARGLRRPVPQGPHLPRPLPRQLGPRHAVGDQRPRGRGPRGDRHALPHRLPARGRLGRGGRRDRAPGDDARRHGGRGEPGRRALPPPRSARRRSSRSSAGACRSSPTTTSRPTSARAR